MEKREYPRSDVVESGQLTIELSEQESLQIRAQTKDVSWGGFCLKMDELEESLNVVPGLIDRPVKIHMHGPHLIVWGHIARFDARSRELAVIISRISDLEGWQAFCDAQG